VLKILGFVDMSETMDMMPDSSAADEAAGGNRPGAGSLRSKIMPDEPTTGWIDHGPHDLRVDRQVA
jgi:hypothetical protein